MPSTVNTILSAFRRHNVQYLLMGGQACILYGGAEFSRDTDIALLANTDNMGKVTVALLDLGLSGRGEQMFTIRRGWPQLMRPPFCKICVKRRVAGPCSISTAVRGVSYIYPMAAPAPLIEQITRTIVERFRPRRVVLFGSHARGESRPDSDIDIMVEMASPLKRGPRTAEVLKVFGIRPWAMDLVVYTPQEVARLRDCPGTLLSVIEAEGQTLYERP